MIYASRSFESGRGGGVLGGAFGRRLMPAEIFVLIGIAFYSGALDRLLAGNPSSFAVVEGAESPLIQMSMALLSLISFGAVVVRKRLGVPSALAISAIGFCCLSLASSAWSDFSEVTLRRAVVLCGTVSFAFAAVSLVKAERMLEILAKASAALILVTGALSVLSPQYAYHQTADVGVFEHAGRLRGMYLHKNDLGRYVALATLIVAVLGQFVSPRRWVRVALLLLGGVLVYRSGSAKVLAALPLALGCGWAMASTSKPGARIAALLILGAGLGFLWNSEVLNSLYGEVLSGLGRSSTLSGRTAVWRAAEIAISDHFWFGSGYATGFRSQAIFLVQQLLGSPLAHAHNGYLEVMVEIGLVGLLLAIVPTVIMLGILVFRTIGQSKWDRATYVLCSSWVVFYCFMNYTGSYIYGYKDLFTVLPILLIFLARHKFESGPHSVRSQP